MNKEAILSDLKTAAQQLDAFISDPQHLGVHERYGDVKRNVACPPYVAMDAKARYLANQQGWYISPEDMNGLGPDVFETLDGTLVTKGAEGYQNPYGPTGLAGPGILGHGVDSDDNPVPENHAVDIVIQFIDPLDGQLKFIGGTRSDTGQPCFVGGFQEKDAFETAVREFIEESISGSVDLRSASPLLHQACETQKRGQQLSQEERSHLEAFQINPEYFTGDEGEAIYHFIAKEDPEFIRDLRDYFEAHLEAAYKGPCRADPRSTDERWIASTLLTGLIDREEIDHILAQQKFLYHFEAGSDLTEVRCHTFNPDFVMTAYASHGPMVCLAVAHNLEKMLSVPALLLSQCEKVIEAIDNKCAPPSSGRPLHSRPSGSPHETDQCRPR